MKTFDISPADAGLRSSKPGELRGGEAMYNAEALRAVLDGQVGPFGDVAVFNAAAALVVAGKADNLKDAAALASKSIESGAAKARLEKLVAVSNES